MLTAAKKPALMMWLMRSADSLSAMDSYAHRPPCAAGRAAAAAYKLCGQLRVRWLLGWEPRGVNPLCTLAAEQ
jgi:hypothetical protein